MTIALIIAGTVAHIYCIDLAVRFGEDTRPLVKRRPRAITCIVLGVISPLTFYMIGAQ